MNILDQPNQIDAYKIACQIAAIKLEGTGLKSRNGSLLAKCKKYYGLKGNRQSVIEQMTARKEQVLSGNS